MKIECLTLAKYVMFQLQKIDNDFSEEELKSVKEIILDYHEIIENQEEFNSNVLLLFPNLERLVLINFAINESFWQNLLLLKNLKFISFEKCYFSDISLIANLNVEVLQLINLNYDDYDFVYEMNNLKELTIIKGNVNLAKINLLKNLKYLELSYCTLEELKETLDLDKLEELYLDNTNLLNIDVSNLPKLKRLGLSSNQTSNASYEVTIYYDSIVPIGGDTYD